MCFISLGYAHSLPSCAGKLLVDFFFPLFKYEKEKSVTAAGFVPIEFSVQMLQPIDMQPSVHPLVHLKLLKAG